MPPFDIPSARGRGNPNPKRARKVRARRVARTPYGGTVKVKRPSVGGPRGSGSHAPQKHAHRVEVKRINRSVKRATVRRNQEKRRKAAQKNSLVTALTPKALPREARIVNGKAVVTRRPYSPHTSFDALQEGVRKQNREAAEYRRQGGKLRVQGGFGADPEATKKITAPAVKVLAVAARPSHAIAGGANAALKGKSVFKAVGKGLSGKGKDSFSDVLKTAGVKNKTVRAVVGFAADVATDPTSYVTLGTGTVARKGVEKGAERKALKVGMRVKAPLTDHTAQKSAKIPLPHTPKKARGAVAQARQALHESVAPDVRPPHLDAQSHKTIRSAERTFRAADGASQRAIVKRAKALKKAAPEHAEQRQVIDAIETGDGLQTYAARHMGARWNAAERHLERPVHVPADSAAIKRAKRRVKRAQADVKQLRTWARPVKVKQAKRKIVEAKAHLGSVRKGEDTLQQLDDAEIRAHMQTNGVDPTRTAIDELPDKLKGVAATLRKDFDAQHKAKEARGIGVAKLKPQGPDDAQAYFPHVNKVQLEPGVKKAGGTVKVSADKGRQIRKPLKTVRDEAPHVFSEDLPKVYAAKAGEVARRTALADMWRKVADTGRKVKPETEIHLGDGELMYEVTPRGLDAVAKREGRSLAGPDLKEMGRIVDGDREGEFVILHQKTVEGVESKLLHPQTADTAIERALDRTQGALKVAVTIPNPGYHSRNLIGDSINAHLADTSAQSFKQSFKGMKALHARERARGEASAVTGEATKRSAKAEKALSQKIKVGKEEHRIDDLLEEAEREGAIRTGQAGQEFRDLLGGNPQKLGRVRAVSEYREDLPRFATYLSARKRGMSPSDAAEWSLKHHFDYGDLTSLERRVLRRAIPFYTFFARNTRLQATKMLTRPGKYANVGKALDESAKYAGYDSYEDYVADLPEYQQRGIPVPLKVGGKTYNVFVAPPLTDANQLTLSITKQFENVAQRITFFKTVPEILTNYSLFFRGPIQNDKRPLVPAPEFVGALPEALRKKLGVAKYQDGRSGKRIWGWPAKVDYVSRQLPQTNVATQLGTKTTGSRGQNAGQAAFGYVSGIKVAERRELDNRINALYDAREKLDNKHSALQQQLGKPKGSREYRKTAESERMKRQLKAIDAQLGQLRGKRKDANIPPNQRPRKGGSSGNAFNNLGGGGGSNAFDNLGK